MLKVDQVEYGYLIFDCICLKENKRAASCAFYVESIPLNIYQNMAVLLSVVVKIWVTIMKLHLYLEMKL